MFLPSRVVLFRVVILRDVIVVTEYVLGCLECCHSHHQIDVKKVLSPDGVMNKQIQTFHNY